MKFIREDNTETNCTVESDLFPMKGRRHTWKYDSPDSEDRVCLKCGREEKTKHIGKRPPKEKGVTGRKRETIGDERVL